MRVPTVVGEKTILKMQKLPAGTTVPLLQLELASRE